MRKLLAGFLLTLRWLLVMLLPLIGLVGGWLLIPEAKPRWELTLPDKVYCAGTIVNDGLPCLLIYGERDSRTNVPTNEVIGVNIVTGEEAFRVKSLERKDMEMELIPGTTCALYQQEYALHQVERRFKSKILLYDWKTKEVINQFDSPSKLFIRRPFTIKNEVLATVFSGDRDEIVFWHLEKKPLPETVEYKLFESSLSSHDIQLSFNGALAIDCYFEHLEDTRRRIDLIDTKQGKLIQRLPGDIDIVRWLPDEESFLALHFDKKSKTQHWQRYFVVNHKAVPAGPHVSAKVGLVADQTPSPYVAVVSSDRFNSIRMYVMNLVGQKQLDQYWPEVNTLDLYETGNGKLIQSLTHPENNLVDCVLGYKVHPHPQGVGLVLQKDKSLSFWVFDSATRWWYSSAGLALGLVLAILLARHNLRRTAGRELWINKNSAV